MTLKHEIRKLALRMGLEVRRFDPLQSAQARLLCQLAHHGVDLVLDVGANDGGYAHGLLEQGFAGPVVSFEPLTSAHARLEARAAGDARWFVAPRMALGDSDQELDLHIAGNSTSSSLLEMGAAHREAAPNSGYVGRERVPVRRLDQVQHPAIDRARAMFLKVDVQGFEMPVLRGAEGLLDRIRGVQLELSVIELYGGQELHRAVMDHLARLGFGLWNLIPGFTDPVTGRMLQYDGVFFRDPVQGGR